MEQMRQVKGATEVALRQLGSMLDTQEVMPLVVWRPKPGAQLPHAVMEVKVRQFEAEAVTQLVALNRNRPLRQAEQVKLAVYTWQLVIGVDCTHELLLR